MWSFDISGLFAFDIDHLNYYKDILYRYVDQYITEYSIPGKYTESFILLASHTTNNIGRKLFFWNRNMNHPMPFIGHTEKPVSELWKPNGSTLSYDFFRARHLEGILPKGPYLPCVSMASRALLVGYHRSTVDSCPRWPVRNKIDIRWGMQSS